MRDDKRKAVFLDRDGTLIEEVNFLCEPDDVRLFPDTVDSLRRLKEAGYMTVVVTNQSGVGRGLFSSDDVRAVHDRIRELTDGLIDAFYHCPHLPDEGCVCRKPSPGMIESAKTDLNLDLSMSYVIGDKLLDVMTGFDLGIPSILVRTGYGVMHQEKVPSESTVVDGIGEAVDLILSNRLG